MTLIELMISLVIGLVVLGALYASYLASSASSAAGRAVSQVTEDATVAINLLRTHIGAAGYSRPVAVVANVTQYASADGPSWVIGCDGSAGSFADLDASILTLACDTTATTSDSLAVAYEATAANSVTRDVSGVATPLDCLGNAITITPIAAGTAGAPGYYVSYSRFFVNNGGLQCRGPGATGSQTLVENIESMQFTYGLSDAIGGRSAVDYRTADEIDAAEWARVVSVRVC
ncbi:PilW family protein, partial [Ideonella sp.]|uniref:PilW family protein n=1 Tax=Ideonella sp. TaxID=1929293 RepID=UPI003BB55555